MRNFGLCLEISIIDFVITKILLKRYGIDSRPDGLV